MSSQSTRFLILLGVTAVGLAGYACGGGSPAGPTHTDAVPAKVQDGNGAVSTSSANNPPVLVYRTTPRHVDNEIFGKAPLQVKINVCNSSDPDEGDSLKSTVDWGDGVETGQHGPGAGTDPQDGNTTGCGGPACCRHRHEYRDPGRYTIKVELSDKHLEDQGQDVEALALTTATLLARVSKDAPAGIGGIAGSLTTLFATNNSFAGNTFDAVAAVPLQITAFEVNLSNPGSTNTVAVYYRVGTAVGNENTAAAWTLLGKDNGVVSAGTDNPSTVSVGGLSMTAGQTYGFYVEVESYPSAAFLYTNGGPTVFANGDLSITTNTGQASPAFSGSFFPRQWDGTINYVK